MLIELSASDRMSKLASRFSTLMSPEQIIQKYLTPSYKALILNSSKAKIKWG
jgi:hypothetical protein